MELRHLNVVVTAAESGSVRRAAPALGMSQAALLAQLRRIETALGGALLRRDGDQLVPTDLGRDFVERARELLARFEALITHS
ncbi:LysR family transcriptional regulator [Actinokineospora soli]|uniref:LysR family transcriptional regulator n=1 Tax=Actinokineospora soli TaxID=1048753 RepID=A0ABW2TWY5_9PSEU